MGNGSSAGLSLADPAFEKSLSVNFKSGGSDFWATVPPQVLSLAVPALERNLSASFKSGGSDFRATVCPQI